MERVWTGDPRRLSRVDRLRIERLTRAGETFATTAAMVGCSVKSIQRYLALSGGLKSRAEEERSALRLSLADREELSRGLVAGDSMRAIAVRLKRSPSTISREVAWNGRRDDYRAWSADSAALERVADPSRPSCHGTRDCAAKWSVGCGRGGLRNRSRLGLSVSILTI